MSKSINIWDYDEDYLKQCSLNELLDTIDKLETFLLSQDFASLLLSIGLVSITEAIADIFNKTALIRNRVFEDAFIEPLPKNWKTKKENILTRLFSALGIIQQYREYYRMVWISSNEALKEVGSLETKIDELKQDYEAKKIELETQVKELKGKFKKSVSDQKTAIQRETKEALEEIQSAEGKIVSHVLTLMGVFTSVIAIILSVIITTSSWLNNASSASAIIAFTVPNLVTLVAVISVVLLIYMYQKSLYPPILKEGDKPTKTPTIISTILLVVVLLIAIFLSILAYRTTRAEPHLRHVISESEYVVKEKQDSNTDEVYKYIEFVFEGESYEFAYDESYFHDSNLYYCPSHNTLE